MKETFQDFKRAFLARLGIAVKEPCVIEKTTPYWNRWRHGETYKQTEHTYVENTNEKGNHEK